MRWLVVSDAPRLDLWPRLPNPLAGSDRARVDNLVLDLRQWRYRGKKERRGLVFDCERLSLAEAVDIAAELARCRAAGLEPVAYAEQLSLATLLAMAPASVRWAPPLAGPLEAAIPARRLQLGRLLARLGNPLLVEAVGQRKVTAHLAGQDGLPDCVLENERLTYGAIVRTALDTLRATLNGQADVEALARRPSLSALEAAERGLITGVGYLAELRSKLASDATRQPLRRRAIFDRAGRRLAPRRPSRALALVDLRGPLYGPLGLPRDFEARLRRAGRDDRVRAILLRIHSGGGDVAQADRLWTLIRALVSHKPVVAYLLGATSAAYQLASAAARIVANPCAPLGGLGALALELDLATLLGRLGVDYGVARYRACPATTTEPEARHPAARLRRRAELAHELMLHRVAVGRGLSKQALDPIADGSLLSPDLAVQHRLVDCVGDFEAALTAAATLGSLEPPFAVVR